MLLYTQVISGAQQKWLFENVYTAYRGRMLALARLPRTELEAYLTVVVERKCIDILRQQARLSGMPFDETLPLVTPTPCGDTLADAMGRLPPRYREALLLRHACGYSTRETAALMELSFAAAQKLLYRARDALRTELEKEAIYP